MVNFDEPVENAWLRSHGRCECQAASHGHRGRCPHVLAWEQRGRAILSGGWQAHARYPRNVAGWEAAKQCEILCWACFAQEGNGHGQSHRPGSL
jgi:hypothetical protein